MGQYHSIYNKTKKEKFSLGGAKLWEKAHNVPASMGLLVLLANSNGRGGGDLCNPLHEDKMYWNGKKHVKRKTPIYTAWSNSEQKNVEFTKKDYLNIEARLEVVSGRWAGDEVVIQGDYAKEGDPAFIADIESYRDITGIVVTALEACLTIDPRSEENKEMLEILQFERECARGRF